MTPVILIILSLFGASPATIRMDSMGSCNMIADNINSSVPRVAKAYCVRQ